ncbi:MAG: ATP-dependent endonuclease [Cellvibrionaceae bacterium]|nr:ATP-dependent endonuclease [Cellvibrionaceae bacterium]
MWLFKYNLVEKGIFVRISSIEVNGFRLLKYFKCDLEKDLSIIVGKNNTGKTSILTVLDKFLSPSERNSFSINDLSIDIKDRILGILSGQENFPDEKSFEKIAISLKLHIEYSEDDDLSSVSELIMSLDPDDTSIILLFEYDLSYNKLEEMKNYFTSNSEKYADSPEVFLKENIKNYFSPISRKSILANDDNIFIDLGKLNINLRKIIDFRFISAKRSVTNKDTDKTLSTQTAKIYKKKVETDEEKEAIEEFKNKLRETDISLDGIYERLFKDLVDKVGKFGGVSENDTDLKIASSLQHRDLLDSNTTVQYTYESHAFPEHYNGLGYMNLISMIFDIEYILGEFRRTKSEKPAAISLLFIEEPEAHTHPQMQYIFIKNIKNLLNNGLAREDGRLVNLQTLLTTHSSHIVSECDFDNIKFLRKDSDNKSVKSKNLRSLAEEYSSEDPAQDAQYKKYYKFLRQYLTLSRSEVFFADKAVLIEGDTERILMPAFMYKVDLEDNDSGKIPLQSQNISIIEVGAHSQTFEKFFEFIGIKSLVITDIDSYYMKEKTDKNGNIQLDGNDLPVQESEKCAPNAPEATHTSNASLLHFFRKEKQDLSFFKGLQAQGKILSKVNDAWIQDENGSLCVAYQTEENGFHARSFEDSFFSINKALLGTDSTDFPSLTKKWFDKYIQGEIDAYEFSEKAVGSKPSLAIEILLNSQEDDGDKFSNWIVPEYIKEGLLWLKKN